MSADGINMLKVDSWLEPKARRILEEIASKANLGTDERVIAWAKLKAWGHGREFACCRVRDLQAPRAEIVVFPICCLEENREREIAKFEDELVVANQQQCAFDLDVPVGRVRAAMARLVKRGLLTTPWVASRSFVTKYKLGEGFRAHLATKQVRAFCPVRGVEQ